MVVFYIFIFYTTVIKGQYKVSYILYIIEYTVIYIYLLNVYLSIFIYLADILFIT